MLTDGRTDGQQPASRGGENGNADVFSISWWPTQQPRPWAKKPRLPGGHWAIEISAQQKTTCQVLASAQLHGPLGFRLAKLSARKSTGDFLGTYNPIKIHKFILWSNLLEIEWPITSKPFQF